MNNKIYLCSFASEDLNKSVDRFEFQAKKMNIYSGIKIFKPKDLDPQLLKRVNNIIKQKGKYLYGYAIWKPAIVKNYLQELEDDAILQYSDIGCHLNYKGLERLNDYIKLIKKNKILALSTEIHQKVLINLIITFKLVKNINLQRVMFFLILSVLYGVVCCFVLFLFWCFLLFSCVLVC